MAPWTAPFEPRLLDLMDLGAGNEAGTTSGDGQFNRAVENKRSCVGRASRAVAATRLPLFYLRCLVFVVDAAAATVDKATTEQITFRC